MESPARMQAMAGDPMRSGWTLFATPLGRCGIAWGGHGILCVKLPEADDEQTRQCLLARLPSKAAGVPPPVAVSAVIEALGGLLRGESRDLRCAVLDLERVSPFERRVYALVRGILPGGRSTYGDIAARLGRPGAARAVGRALGRNPFPLIVPCHRVLAAHGGVGGFSAHGGVATKCRLLAIEAHASSGQGELFPGSW